LKRATSSLNQTASGESIPKLTVAAAPAQGEESSNDKSRQARRQGRAENSVIVGTPLHRNDSSYAARAGSDTCHRRAQSGALPSVDRGDTIEARRRANGGAIRDGNAADRRPFDPADRERDPFEAMPR
jgi:hypothetical protein